jgi:hypothetical protein
VRAAEKNRLDAVALLIDLGFEFKPMNRTAALRCAPMCGNLEMISY